MVLLTALTLAGAGAVAALGGYAIYRGSRAAGSSHPTLSGLATAAALFVWTALTLPLAAFVLTGGLVVGLALLPVLLAGAGVYLLLGPRRRPQRDPDTVTIN
jgi:hypothetical protein